MKPELLSPVSDWTMLQAAIDAGADAVYFSVQYLANMRIKAPDFTIHDLRNIVGECHTNKVRAYLTLNTFMYEFELPRIKIILEAAKQAGIDAVIAWDIAVMQEAQRLNIPIHVSTQASVSNSAAAEFFVKSLNVERIVVAREITLEQINEIKKKLPGLQIEAFIHGAMCVAQSGRCFMSLEKFGKSANRGHCMQNCRREYLVTDEENNQFVVGKDYVMSPNDLCTMPFIEQLIEADISCFKIEGRKRSPEYVKVTTECYRKAIDYYGQHKNKPDFFDDFQQLKKALTEKLATVYNRGFSTGHFMGRPIDAWCRVYGSKATTRKIFLGLVENYYEKAGAADIKLQAYDVKLSDKIMFQGPTTGVFEQELASMKNDDEQEIEEAKRGQLIGIKVEKKVRKNDKVFIIKKVTEENKEELKPLLQNW